MSIVAEFARLIHEKAIAEPVRTLTPVWYPSKTEKLFDVKAVIFDVYGTLVNYWIDEFSDPAIKETVLLKAFRATADFFGFSEYLDAMNPVELPEKTLQDLYLGLIALNHEKSIKRGSTYPEVRIEEVWEVLIMMLVRHGYNEKTLGLGTKSDLAKCVAFYYNFHALGRNLYDDVVDSLTRLQQQNIKLGILSNAQFYSTIDLTLLLRDQSGNLIDDYLEIFDKDLVVFSFEHGVAKPNPALFQKLYDGLYELQILPSQTVFVGNDLLQDIKPAQEIGMATALFTGDDKSAFFHDQQNEIIPDIVFQDWKDLPEKVSFFNDKTR